MSVLLQTKTIFETKLFGVVPWKSVQVNSQTTQFLAAFIETPKGHTYTLNVGSSYHAPPLGSVVLIDTAAQHEIQGQNQDATWHKVVEYIRAKEEGSSAVAAAKVAETVPEPLRATVYAAPRDDDEPVLPPFPVVYFVAEKGEFFRNGPALVTKVNPDGSLNMSVFADNSEVFFVQNIQPRSETLRNRCYVEYPALARPVEGHPGAEPPKRRGRQPKPAEEPAAAPESATDAPGAAEDSDVTLEELERLTAPDAA